MSKAAYWQRGETLDFTNSDIVAIEANTIRPFGKRLGVVGTTVQSGEIGTLHMTGVFEIPKDANEITEGAELYWDETNEHVTETKGSLTILAGYAAQEASASAEVVLVKLLG